jgi:hypothetical protein
MQKYFFENPSITIPAILAISSNRIPSHLPRLFDGLNGRSIDFTVGLIHAKQQ